MESPIPIDLPLASFPTIVRQHPGRYPHCAYLHNGASRCRKAAGALAVKDLSVAKADVFKKFCLFELSH